MRFKNLSRENNSHGCYTLLVEVTNFVNPKTPTLIIHVCTLLDFRNITNTLVYLLSVEISIFQRTIVQID